MVLLAGFRYWLAFRLASASLTVAPRDSGVHELPLSKVTEFFTEHPVHDFSIRTIAAYLGEGETEVELTVSQLESAGLLVRRYRLLHPDDFVKEEGS